jgi:hypothetical protein
LAFRATSTLRLPSGEVAESGSDPKLELGVIVDTPDTREVIMTAIIPVRINQFS